MIYTFLERGERSVTIILQLFLTKSNVHWKFNSRTGFVYEMIACKDNKDIKLIEISTTVMLKYKAKENCISISPLPHQWHSPQSLTTFFFCWKAEETFSRTRTLRSWNTNTSAYLMWTSAVTRETSTPGSVQRIPHKHTATRYLLSSMPMIRLLPAIITFFWGGGPSYCCWILHQKLINIQVCHCVFIDFFSESTVQTVAS